MLKKILELEKRLMKKRPPKVHVICVEEFRGETKEEALERFEKENNIKNINKDLIIWINVPSDEQIRERKNNDIR